MADWRDAPLVDEMVSAQLAADLDPVDFQAVHDAFAGDIRHRAGELAVALRRGDQEQAKRAAHSLKGAALNLGYLRLGELCAQLNGLAQAGDLAAVAALWPAFAATCDEALTRLGHSGLAFEIDSSIVRR